MSNCSNCPSKGSCNNKEHCSIENNPQNHIEKIIKMNYFKSNTMEE